MRLPWMMTRSQAAGLAGRRHLANPRGARLLAVVLTAFLFAAPLVQAHEEHENAPPAAVDWPAADQASSPAMGQRLEAVGFLALPGFNADVWTHENVAYVGTWGSNKDGQGACPASGLRVVDLSDPRQPALVGAVASIPGTSQEDVAVKRVETPAFQGNLLVTGIQACLPSSAAARGLDLWDVTDPRQPQHLAFWSSGPAGGAAGVHELHVFERDGRAYVAAAVPFAEERDGRGEFRFVDVTDPRRPVEVGSWSAGANGGFAPRQGQTFFGHSATINAAGTLAVISY